MATERCLACGLEGDDIELVQLHGATWHEPADYGPLCLRCRAERERDYAEQVKGEREWERRKQEEGW